LEAIRRNQAIQLNILMDRPANDPITLPDKVSKIISNYLDERSCSTSLDSGVFSGATVIM
ncbi:MAG: hypothetical protein CL693_20215, partial [Cellvibrionaceae bacterium]|nr:hypothetical protein [Cellvibrionaceae bacterium]